MYILYILYIYIYIYVYVYVYKNLKPTPSAGEEICYSHMYTHQRWGRVRFLSQGSLLSQSRHDVSNVV